MHKSRSESNPGHGVKITAAEQAEVNTLALVGTQHLEPLCGLGVCAEERDRAEPAVALVPAAVDSYGFPTWTLICQTHVDGWWTGHAPVDRLPAVRWLSTTPPQ